MIKLVVPETKRPATIDELSALVKSHTNTDFVIRLGEMHLNQDILEIEGTKKFALRENGFKNLLSELGMPFGYASNIPNDLLQDSVNRLIKTYGDFEVLVRSQDGEIRGMLEPNYVPLDCETLVGRLDKCTKAGLIPARLQYDGDSVVASLVTDKAITATKVGDISKIGISLETSDINLSQLMAGSYLYRLACTNGAVLPAQLGGEISFNQKKVNPDTVWNLFDEGYQRILQNMSALNSEFLIRLENTKVDAASFIKAEEKLAAFAGGRKVAAVLKDMEAQLKEKGTDYTFYDIYNTITSAARDEASLYTAQNLEKAAGNLLYSFGVSKS